MFFFTIFSRTILRHANLPPTGRQFSVNCGLLVLDAAKILVSILAVSSKDSKEGLPPPWEGATIKGRRETDRRGGGNTIAELNAVEEEGDDASEGTGRKRHRTQMMFGHWLPDGPGGRAAAIPGGRGGGRDGLAARVCVGGGLRAGGVLGGGGSVGVAGFGTSIRDPQKGPFFPPEPQATPLSTRDLEQQTAGGDSGVDPEP